MFFFLSKFVPSMTFNMYWLHHSINLLKIVPFLGGWLSDRLLGDPEGWPHPIVWFGSRAYPWRVFNLREDIVVGLDHTSAVQWVADGCRRILLPIREDAY